jgi:hypothetical protein
VLLPKPAGAQTRVKGLEMARLSHSVRRNRGTKSRGRPGLCSLAWSNSEERMTIPSSPAQQRQPDAPQNRYTAPPKGRIIHKRSVTGNFRRARIRVTSFSDARGLGRLIYLGLLRGALKVTRNRGTVGTVGVSFDTGPYPRLLRGYPTAAWGNLGNAYDHQPCQRKEHPDGRSADPHLRTLSRCIR